MEVHVAEDVDPKIDEKECAKRLNCTPRFLQNDRTRNDCIPYYKIGDLVRYDWGEVCRHLQTKRPKRCAQRAKELHGQQGVA